jgi:HD-GYP domain-containing protein (c-di-GMP phosphodiesterase class II)/HAMP domain-containing protein
MNGGRDSTPRSGLRRRFIGGRSLRRTFLAAFLLATMVPLAAYAASSYVATAASLHAQERQQMTDHSRSVLAMLDARRNDLRNQVRSNSEGWPQLAEAIRRHDVRWLRANATDWVIDNQNIQAVQTFDLNGHAISLAGELTRLSLGSSSIARLALRTRTAQSAFMVLEGQLYAVAAETVTAANPPAPAAGLLIFAIRLDGPTFAQLAGMAGVQSVAAYADGGLMTPVPGAPAQAAAERADQRVGEAQSVGNDMVLYERLPADGTAVALRVSVKLSSVAAAGSSLRATALWSLLGAVAIALVIGLLLSQRVIRPMRRLARAALDMASGDTRQHLSVPHWEELADVANAFNRMSEGVSAELEALAHAMGNLSEEIGRLGEFGETLAQTRDVAAELGQFAQMVARVFEAGSARIYLWRTDRFVLAAAYGELLDDHQALDLATSAASKRVPVVRDDVAEAGASALAVPILHCGETIGVIVVGSGGQRLYRRDDVSMLVAMASQLAIALKQAESYEKLDRSYLETVKGLAAAMEAKDHYTAAHADKLAEMALAVGQRLGLCGPELRQLEYAAVLHDIGKIGVPGHVLNKPGKLSKEEFALVAEHTIIGEGIISRIEYLRPVAQIVRSAHERWDGAGYPDGLSGESIPLASRIVLVCDAFHAMTSDRPYRAGLPPATALEELRSNAGHQFDPRIVEAFLEVAPSFAQDDVEAVVASLSVA